MIRAAVRLAPSVVLATVTLGVPGALAAQDSTAYTNHLYDTFQATADFTTVLNRSKARVDAADGGRGTTLDFKELLGVSGTLVQPAFGFRWKPGRHTELDVGYQFINATGARTLADDIVVGEDTILADFDVNTRLGSDNATFQFKYSLWAAERHNIGLALGLGAIFFRMDLDATAHGCVGTACDSGAVSISKNFTGPTASLGAFGQWRLGNRWYLGGDARGIGARVDRYDFSVLEANAAGSYYLSNRWGLEVGLYYTDVSVDVAPESGTTDPTNFAGNISYNYTSFRLGVIGVF